MKAKALRGKVRGEIRDLTAGNRENGGKQQKDDASVLSLDLSSRWVTRNAYAWSNVLNPLFALFSPVRSRFNSNV